MKKNHCKQIFNIHVEKIIRIWWTNDYDMDLRKYDPFQTIQKLNMAFFLFFLYSKLCAFMFLLL
jgi:hypothetical protein